MPRHGVEAKVYAGPIRDEVPLPVVAAGADYVPGAGWTEITNLVTDPRCEGNEHESVLTLTVAGYALDTGTFLIDRQGKVRFISTGSGEEEIAELGAMVKKLIEEPVSPMSTSESSEKN